MRADAVMHDARALLDNGLQAFHRLQALVVAGKLLVFFHDALFELRVRGEASASAS